MTRATSFELRIRPLFRELDREHMLRQRPDLDLRQARFAAREVTLTINAMMGGATIIVNRSTQVIMHGVGIMGGYSGPRTDSKTQLTADSPVVHVRGVAIMGGVSVVRKAMPGEDKTPGWRYRH